MEPPATRLVAFDATGTAGWHRRVDVWSCHSGPSRSSIVTRPQDQCSIVCASCPPRVAPTAQAHQTASAAIAPLATSIEQVEFELGACPAHPRSGVERRPRRRAILIRRNQSGNHGRPQDHHNVHGSNYPFEYIAPTVSELTVLANILPSDRSTVFVQARTVSAVQMARGNRFSEREPRGVDRSWDRRLTARSAQCGRSVRLSSAVHQLEFAEIRTRADQ